MKQVLQPGKKHTWEKRVETTVGVTAKETDVVLSLFMLETKGIHDEKKRSAVAVLSNQQSPIIYN